MKLLLIADTHSIGFDMWKIVLNLKESDFDIIAILGDVNGTFLKTLNETFPNKRKIGVLGNHDRKGHFDHYDVENIHNRIIEIDGIKFAGIEGSVRYKDGDNFPLYTQMDIINLCDELDYADIVISHNSPYGIHDSSDIVGDIAHLGFQGLMYYIESKKPIYCIHGHQHINKFSKLEHTGVLGIHGAFLLDLKEGTLHTIL